MTNLRFCIILLLFIDFPSSSRYCWPGTSKPHFLPVHCLIFSSYWRREMVLIVHFDESQFNLSESRYRTIAHDGWQLSLSFGQEIRLFLICLLINYSINTPFLSVDRLPKQIKETSFENEIFLNFYLARSDHSLPWIFLSFSFSQLYALYLIHWYNFSSHTLLTPTPV